MGQMIFADQIATVEQSKVDAARMTQESGNARRGSDAALAAFSASLGNMRRMDAAGSAVSDSAANSVRAMRSQTQGRLSMDIQEAEELGMVAAQAGAAGIGGGSVESYNETVRLTNALKVQEMERSFSEVEFANGQQRANTIKAAVAQNDTNNYTANLDYTQYLDWKKPSFFERVSAITSTVAATALGGPEAGAAVMGIFESRQSLRNGDIAGADQALQGSLRSALGAVDTANALKAPAPVDPFTNMATNGDAVFGFGGRINAPNWSNINI
jgi:hypothetical protein